MIALFGREFNPLDKYWQAGFRAAKSPFFVAPANVFAGAHNHKRQFCEGWSRFPVQQLLSVAMSSCVRRNGGYTG